MLKEKISKTILVSKSAYLYLDRVSRIQRGCKPITTEQESKLWKRLPKVKGKAQLDDNSMGGGDGTYHGRWWGWNVDTLKEMLTEAGFTYESGDDIYYLNV